MSNNTPLNITTDAAGGYLFEEQYGDMFIDGIARESAVAKLCQVKRLSSKREKYAVYSGRPAVEFVDESAEKTATGAEFGQVTLNVKKIAGIVIYTEELLEDAAHDPRLLINQDMIAAFAQKIDAHALGYENGSAIVSRFDSELGETSQTTELGTGGDAFAVALSSAIDTVEGNGYTVNGAAVARDVKKHLRDQRQTVETAQAVYTPGFEREPDSIYGVPLTYTTNLDAFNAGAGKKAAVVGDFSHAVLGIRKDLTARISTEATVTVGGTPRNLWQRNEVAVLWEMRVGFAAHDVNRTFVAITNAS